MGGVVSSTAFVQAGGVDALPSKTIVAWLATNVPVTRVFRGATVSNTLPSPSVGVWSGGRNPISGGGPPVAGSIELNDHVIRPVAGSRADASSTMRFRFGRISMLVA